MRELMYVLPDGDPDELYFIQQITRGLEEEEMDIFINMYRGKRQSPQTFLLTAALGLIWIAGIQRFLAGQIGMGLLYLFTGGLCWIGTIMDMVNYKRIALEANMRAAQETVIMIDRMAID